jgi:hypothetical protein
LLVARLLPVLLLPLRVAGPLGLCALRDSLPPLLHALGAQWHPLVALRHSLAAQRHTLGARLDAIAALRHARLAVAGLRLCLL